MSLRLHGDRAIAQAVEAARAFGDGQRLANGELARLCIVVEELVANLYDHGGVTGQEEVTIVLTRAAKGVHLSITDRGAAFNPWTAMPARHGRKGGGAGVKLVQAWSELIGYHSSDQGNRLELLIPLP